MWSGRARSEQECIASMKARAGVMGRSRTPQLQILEFGPQGTRGKRMPLRRAANRVCWPLARLRLPQVRGSSGPSVPALPVRVCWHRHRDYQCISVEADKHLCFFDRLLPTLLDELQKLLRLSHRSSLSSSKCSMANRNSVASLLPVDRNLCSLTTVNRLSSMASLRRLETVLWLQFNTSAIVRVGR